MDNKAVSVFIQPETGMLHCTLQKKKIIIIKKWERKNGHNGRTLIID